jgi:ribulose-bisphosphate carboxylase large chain
MPRFSVTYSLAAATAKEAREKAFDICVEQTVEFPYDLIAEQWIRDRLVGQVETVARLAPGRYAAQISYDDATAGCEATQFLNVLFGNTSIKPGIRIERICPSRGVLGTFPGPRFGVRGVRRLLGVQGRPLLCSALKPMGLSARALGELAYRFALGGIDLIKDDHGLADQYFAPFEERVRHCVEAVRRANRETGGRCRYVPNVTADGIQTLQRARAARRAGAGAVMISAALTGFATMREVARDDRVGVPVFFHPAFAGTLTTSPQSGISHLTLYGQMARLFGADVSIFPSFGGRFSFTPDECRSVAEGCRMRMGSIKPCLPAPGGGIRFETVAEIVAFYGPDTLFLIGGGLFRYSRDITKACRDLRTAVQQAAAARRLN